MIYSLKSVNWIFSNRKMIFFKIYNMKKPPDYKNNDIEDSFKAVKMTM